MRGRPPVVGLRAVVVAMMLVALPSGAVLAEQIRPTLPGLGAKPKAKHVRRPFRPTLPQRNPTRVSADIIASIKVDGTASPLSASGADASGMAGATSAANVAVAGAGIPPQDSAQDPIEVAAAEPASEPETTAALAEGDDTAPAETASDEQDSASAATEPTDAAPADAEPTDAEPVAADEEPSADTDGAMDAKPTAETADAAVDETEASAAKETTDDATDESEAQALADSASPDDSDVEPAKAEEPTQAEAEADDAQTPAPAAEAHAPVDQPSAASESSPPKETARLEPEPKEVAPKETARLEPEPEVAEPEKAEPKEAELKEAEPEKAEAEEAELKEAEPETAEAKEAEPEKAEPGKAEPETAEPVEAEAAAEAAEAEQPVAPDEAEPKLAEAEPAEAELAEAEPVETATPSYDATVVIDILPPPDQADEATAEDDAPMELAAVTPPSEPAPGPAIPAVDETSDDADADNAPTDAAADSDKADTAETAETPSAETPSAETPSTETSSETAPKDDDGTPATAAEDATEPEGAVVTVAPPPPPPAHPVVVAIREKLADPGFRKGFNASTLKGLEDFYGAHEGPPLWITDGGFTPKAQALIAEIGNADDWGLDARVFDPPQADAHPATEEEQAAAELKLAMAVLKYARYAQGGARSPSSYSPLFDQRPQLTSAETVLTKIATAPEPATYLTSLHPQHDQFKALRAALVKARARAAAVGREPRNDHDVQLLVVNMERWRWLPRHLGSYYVWNNVPEFNVRVMKNGKVIYLEKTIVGQLKYATPFFSAPMRNIVFHPNWTVPPTIVNEDLAPKLESPGGFFSPSKTDMLRGYGLSVSYKGKPVDADDVDWRNVNIHEYTFTQDPGPTNVLGQFKFNFPNRHAIYMHDTVQRELFAERTRTLSHGCIRVREPDRFAALLLSQDKGWSYGQIQRLVAKDSSTVIGLNHKVPVHLTYFTATIDENGQLNRFGDIYGIDNRMAAKMFDNPARFPVPATPAIAEQSSRSRDQGRRARSGGGLDDLISGLFGN